MAAERNSDGLNNNVATGARLGTSICRHPALELNDSNARMYYLFFKLQ